MCKIVTVEAETVKYHGEFIDSARTPHLWQFDAEMEFKHTYAAFLSWPGEGEGGGG